VPVPGIVGDVVGLISVVVVSPVMVVSTGVVVVVGPVLSLLLQPTASTTAAVPPKSASAVLALVFIRLSLSIVGPAPHTRAIRR